MRSIWFSLIGPTVSEVEAHLLASGCVQTEGQGSALNYPAGDACVLLIDCDDYRWVERWELQDEYEDLCSAIGGQTPTVHVLAHVSGRVPGAEEVRFLARCLLERFDGYAFDDYLGYSHAWRLAEILASARVDGLHFFDYRGHYQEQQKRPHRCHAPFEQAADQVDTERLAAVRDVQPDYSDLVRPKGRLERLK